MTRVTEIPKRAADSLAARVFTQALQSMLVPAARLAIRMRVPCDLAVQALRSAFVKAAVAEAESTDKRASDVAIQAMTGLPRKSIAKIQSEGILAGRNPSPVAKILGGWCADEEYRENGEPAEIAIRALNAPCFARLVKKFTPDLAYRPVLDQLVEAGNVEITDYGTVRLVSAMYDPPKEVLNAMSAGMSNVAHHIETVVHNITQDRAERLTERKRLSRYIPRELNETINQQIQTVLQESERRVAQILDEAEVSPDDVELMTVGAGFYLFKDLDV